MAVTAGKITMLDAATILALTSLTIYGLTQVLAKFAVGSVNATSMVALNFSVSLPIYIFFLICTLLVVSTDELSVEYVIYGLVGAATARGGYYIYLEALESGPVTMVGSITAAFPAITAALAVTVLGETLKPINAVGISVIIASMVLLSFAHGRSSRKSTFPKSAIFLSIATLLIWGFGGVFIKLALSELPLVAYLGLYPFILPPIAFAYLRHKKAKRENFFPRWTVPVICAVMVAELWQLGYFAETAAVSQGAAAIVYPLISAYPVVTIVAAHFVLKEHLSRTDWTLLAAVVLGITLTTL